jgi:predicted RNase H-like HicB family nuclease
LRSQFLKLLSVGTILSSGLSGPHGFRERLDREDPDGDFVVIFPDLPECVTCVDSLEAAPAAAAEVLADRLEKMEWIGQSIPEPSTYEAIRGDPQNMGCEVTRVEASDRP